MLCEGQYNLGVQSAHYHDVRRVLGFICITWLPLLIWSDLPVSAIQGRTLGRWHFEKRVLLYCDVILLADFLWSGRSHPHTKFAALTTCSLLSPITTTSWVQPFLWMWRRSLMKWTRTTLGRYMWHMCTQVHTSITLLHVLLLVGWLDISDWELWLIWVVSTAVGGLCFTWWHS